MVLMKCSQQHGKMLNDTTLSKGARQKKVIKYDFDYFEKHKKIGRKSNKMLMALICGWWDYGWLFFLFILAVVSTLGIHYSYNLKFLFLFIRKGQSSVVNCRSKLRSMVMKRGVQGVLRSPWN